MHTHQPRPVRSSSRSCTRTRLAGRLAGRVAGRCAGIAVALGAAALGAGVAAPLRAQVVRGGDLVTTDFSVNAVWRIDATGAVTSLHTGLPLTGPAGVIVARDGDVIVADFNSSSLVRISALTGVATPFATGLGGPLRVAEDAATGDFVVTSNTQRALLRVSPAGVVTTLASGVPLNRPFSVSQDWNGDFLVADDLGRALHRVTPAGVVTPIFTGLPLRLPQGIALFPNGDYAVIDGVVDVVFRIDRATGAITTFCPNAQLGGNPEGIVPDFGGGFVVAQSGSAGSRIVGVDPAAGVLQLAAGAPMVNIEDVAKVPQLSGPDVLTTGPGSTFAFAVDAPAAAGHLSTLVLSLSVHPGWPFPVPGELRSLTVNADAFFFATIGQNAPPLLVNWTTFLDASGRSTATADLSLLPQGALAGLEVFQQGFTVTPSLQIGVVHNARKLRLQ